MRASIARLIHAEPDDIAFVPNAAAALSIVLAGIAPKPGENIVTLDDEFPNYLYQDVAREGPLGALLRFRRCPHSAGRI